LGTLLCTASTSASDIPAGKNVKVTGLILSRNGDTVRIKDKKSGQFVVVNITDNTKIERKRGHLEFLRQTDMDVTALVPGLTIEAEGRGDAKGRREAERISFNPDEFAVEVAEQQEVMANRKAAKEAKKRPARRREVWRRHRLNPQQIRQGPQLTGLMQRHKPRLPLVLRMRQPYPC
jgi:hypothetical protein